MLRYDTFLGGEQGVIIPSDPYWADVKILLYGEGADGNTTFTDHSPVGRSLSHAGNVQHDAGIDVNGQSILFDGTGDYIFASDTAGLRIDTATDFTMEAYIRPSSLSKALACLASKRATSGGQSEFVWWISSAGTLRMNILDSSNNSLLNLETASGLIIDDTLHHVAFTRAGTTVRLFADGDEAASGTQVGTVGASTNSFIIGRDNFNTGRDFVGNMNWFRYTKGVARYTGDFTPPSVPFPEQ